MSLPSLHKFWPYAQEQDECVPHLIDRFSVWKTSIGCLIEFFVANQSLEKLVAKEHFKLQQKMEENERSLGSTAVGVFKPWHIYGMQTQTALSIADQQISNLIVKRLEILKAEIKRKMSGFESDLTKYQKKINKIRTKTAEVIGIHEAELLARVQTNAAPSSPHINLDPWLNERMLQQLLKDMVVDENMYQKSMFSLFQEIRVFDAHVVEELKRIMEEYNLIRTTQWTSQQVI